MIEQLDLETLTIADNVKKLIKCHCDAVGINTITNMHDLVLEQVVEKAMLQTVIESCKYNQRRAANALGLSRGTCRSLLIKHFGDKYCATRESKSEE